LIFVSLLLLVVGLQMHEMSLADGVLRLIKDSAKANSFPALKTVWLEWLEAGMKQAAARN